MRKLSREYGWAALGVYLALTALDFPFCFAAVRLLGVERIGHYERVILDSFKGLFPGGSKAGSDSDSVGDNDGDGESAIVQAHQGVEEASMCPLCAG